MKADRKHELETNELADSLAKFWESVQQNFAPLALILGVVVVGGVAYALIFAEKPPDAPAGDWNKVVLAMSNMHPEKELELFLDQATDQRAPAVVQAKLSLADAQLANASKLLFEDRKAAGELLEKAQKYFQEVDAVATDSLMRNRARLGLASVYESQNKTEEAQKLYEQVSKSGSAESVLAKVAVANLKRLASKENREFLAWFVKQEPAPKRNPHMGFPFDPQSQLPETKDFTLPSLPPGEGDIGSKPLLPELTPPGKTEGTPETPAIEIPAPESKPAVETPTAPAEKSEAKKPVEEAAPETKVDTK